MAATLKSVSRRLNIIWDVVYGKADDPHDLGLKEDVVRNTELREKLYALMWLMLVTFVGGNITLLFLGPKLLASAIKTAIGEP